MTTLDTTGENRPTRRPEVDLDRRYGRIAISALVAALPYGGDSKAQAPESAEERKDRERKHRERLA
jgi:hypothetical protein